MTDANPSPAPWTQSELFSYLRSGASPLHGVTAGPMSPVIHAGLAALPDSDIRAQAIYFADIDHAAAREPAVEAAVKKALATSPLGITQDYDPDAHLYVAACIACHFNGGPALLTARPELALNSALTLPEPTNFIHIVLNGIAVSEGGPGLMMPGYASALDDTEIARLADYLRRTRTDRPAWSDVERRVATVRQQAAASE